MIKTIYLCPHSHVDIGYTHPANEVRDIQFHATRDVLKLCRATAHLPEDEQFRWTFESAWVLDEFLRRAPEADSEEIMGFLRSGQLELAAFYTQPLTQVPMLEELVRLTSWAVRTSRRCGFSVRTAMLNDIGGATWNLPQVLARSGVSNFLLGTGGYRVHVLHSSLPRLFRHESPDGSRVVFYNMGHDRSADPSKEGTLNATYAFGRTYVVRPLRESLQRGAEEGFDPMMEEKPALAAAGREPLDSLLARIATEDYPADILLLQYASDNGGPDADLVESVRHWNRLIKEPRVRLATPKDFFRDLAEHCTDELPVCRGDLSCPWSDHVGTMAYETGFYRRASRRLTVAETLGSLVASAKGAQCDPAPLADAVWNLQHFSDHTYGQSMWDWPDALEAVGSMEDSVFDSARSTWENKRNYALSAEVLTRNRLERAVGDLASVVKPESVDTFLVFNPLSWERTCVVDYFERCGRAPVAVRDVSTGRLLAVDGMRCGGPRGRITFVAPDLPPVGYRCFELVWDGEAPGATGELRVEDTALENEFVRVELNPKTGGVRSLVDKRSGRDLADGGAPWGLNQLLYARLEGVNIRPVGLGICDDVKRHWAEIRDVELLPSSAGSVVGIIRLCANVAGGPAPMRLHTEVRIDAVSPRIEFVNTLVKECASDKEEAFFAFPFAMEDFSVDVQQAGCAVRVPDDQLPGSALHCLGIQDWAFLDDRRGGVLWTAAESALVELDRMRAICPVDHPPRPERAHLFAYVLHNMWNTNCQSWQGGRMRFRFTVLPTAPGFETAECFRAGLEANTPALCRRCLGDDGFMPASAESLLRIEPDNVILSTLKPADDGDGWILRCVEVAGTRSELVVKAPALRITEFVRCDLTEQPLGEWQGVSDGTLAASIGPHEIVTFRLRSGS